MVEGKARTQAKTKVAIEQIKSTVKGGRRRAAPNSGRQGRGKGGRKLRKIKENGVRREAGEYAGRAGVEFRVCPPFRPFAGIKAEMFVFSSRRPRLDSL